jgi:hypothetical protein
VERSIRKWRQTAVDDISVLGYQAGMARAERNPPPAGAILDLKI